MFWARVGNQFSKEWIYVDPDLHEKPHIWHQTNSLPYTQIFGPLACRVCSKIVGIGSAERAWGSVKKLKDNQRSHMGAKSVMKQATLYGAYCSKKVQNKRKETGKEITYWEEDDFKNLGLDKYLIDIDMITGKIKETRTFFAFVQDWEKEAIDLKSNNNEIMLRRKYGGMKYYNCDTDKGTFSPRTIDINKLIWSNKKGDKCYKLQGLKDELPELHPQKVEEWYIEKDLFFMIIVYYKKHPDPSIKIVTYNEYAGLPEDNNGEDEWIENGGFFSHQLQEGEKKRSRDSAKKSVNNKQAKKLKRVPGKEIELTESEEDSDVTVGNED